MLRNRTFALVAAALVALTVLPGAAAAAPGNGNGDQATGDSHEAGPPDGLPEPVPGFVEEIHAQIRAFLDGSIGDLGSAVSDIAAGDHGSSGDGA